MRRRIRRLDGGIQRGDPRKLEHTRSAMPPSVVLSIVVTDGITAGSKAAGRPPAGSFLRRRAKVLRRTRLPAGIGTEAGGEQPDHSLAEDHDVLANGGQTVHDQSQAVSMLAKKTASRKVNIIRDGNKPAGSTTMWLACG